MLALTYLCAAEMRVSTADLLYEGCLGFRCKLVSTIIIWVIPEGRTSTANDTSDACGALKGIGAASLTSNVGGAPAKTERGGDKRTDEYAQFRRTQ
jgi:hypothetical protein